MTELKEEAKERAAKSIDSMQTSATGDSSYSWQFLTHKVLGHLGNCITNKVLGILQNRIKFYNPPRQCT